MFLLDLYSIFSIIQFIIIKSRRTILHLYKYS